MFTTVTGQLINNGAGGALEINGAKLEYEGQEAGAPDRIPLIRTYGAAAITDTQIELGSGCIAVEAGDPTSAGSTVSAGGEQSVTVIRSTITAGENSNLFQAHTGNSIEISSSTLNVGPQGHGIDLNTAADNTVTISGSTINVKQQGSAVYGAALVSENAVTISSTELNITEDSYGV